MIPIIIINDIPFPRPLSVICSPSHIINITPDVSKNTVDITNKGPESGTTGMPEPACCADNFIAIPHALNIQITTVNIRVH